MSPVTLVADPGWPAWHGWLGAAIIKTAQPSAIYHTGIVIGDTLFEARLTTGVVAVPAADRVRDHWLRVPCPWCRPERAVEVFETCAGAEYDLLRGLPDWFLRRVAHTLGVRIRPGIDDPRRWFCSELSAAMLGFDDPVRYSPSRLMWDALMKSAGATP